MALCHPFGDCNLLKPRTIYIDDDTYGNLTRLADYKGLSKSAITRIIINELHFDYQFGDAERAKSILDLVR